MNKTEMAKKLATQLVKRYSIFLTLAAAVMLFAPLPALALECSCTAPDNTCSASVTCQGGCWAICGTGGHCGSGCSGAGSWTPENNGLHADQPGKGLPRGVTISARGLTSTELADALRQQLGSFNFVPSNPTETFDIDVSNMPPGELRRALSEFGAVATDGADPSAKREDSVRRAIPSANVSLKIDNATAGQVAEILNQLLEGATVRLSAKNLYEPLSIDVQDMDLDSLIQGLQATSSIRIINADR